MATRPKTPAQTPRPQGKKLTPTERAAAQAVFLQAYAELGTVTAAARAAGIDRRTFYSWRDADPRFGELLDDAISAHDDHIRAEIERRAIAGWEEPVYQGGELVGTRRVYDGRLLALMARRLPEYRAEKHVSVDMDLPGMTAQREIQAILADPTKADAACDLLGLLAPSLAEAQYRRQ